MLKNPFNVSIKKKFQTDNNVCCYYRNNFKTFIYLRTVLIVGSSLYSERDIVRSKSDITLKVVLNVQHEIVIRINRLNYEFLIKIILLSNTYEK